MAGILSNTGASGNGPLGLGILPKIQARIQAITHPTPPGPKIVSHTMQFNSNLVFTGSYTFPPIKAVAGGSVYVLVQYFPGQKITDNMGNTYNGLLTTAKIVKTSSGIEIIYTPSSKGRGYDVLSYSVHFQLCIADNVSVPSSGQLALTLTMPSASMEVIGLGFAIIALSGTANPSFDALGDELAETGPTASASVSTSAANDLVLAFFLTQGTAPAISGGTLLDAYYDSKYGLTISDAYAIGSSSGTATISAAVQNPSTGGTMNGYWDAQAISIKAATSGG